jgi:hypothetical protein
MHTDRLRYKELIYLINCLKGTTAEVGLLMTMAMNQHLVAHL